MSGPNYKTNELARLVGVSKNTLLRWEEEGVISPALRDGRGWRVWPKSAIEKIQDVKRNKDTTKVQVSEKEKLRVNIIGYGNQGSAWAKNLKDSGAYVTILLKKNSPSIKEAVEDGFEVVSIENGLKRDPYGVFCVMIPDGEHELFFKEHDKYIDPKALFVFAHGYSIGYQCIKFKARKALLSPKAIGVIVRSSYINGGRVPAAFYVESSEDGAIVKDIAKKLGFAPLIPSTFLEETILNLFAEQVLFCGGVPALIVKAFEMAKQKGLSKDIMIHSCVYELSYMLDAIKQIGIGGMYEAISPVAMSGGFKIWQEMNKDKSIEEVLSDSLDDIESKRFLSTIKNTNRTKILSEVKQKTKNFDIALKEMVQ